MLLALMLETDEDAVTCDMAETYGIFDIESIDIGLLATLCSGLRSNSRIKMKIAGVRSSYEQVGLAALIDGVNTLVWMLSNSSQEGTEKPPSVLKALTMDQKEDDTVLFEDGDSFMEAREMMMRGGVEDGGRSNNRESLCADTPEHKGD